MPNQEIERTSSVWLAEQFKEANEYFLKAIDHLQAARNVLVDSPKEGDRILVNSMDKIAQQLFIVCLATALCEAATTPEDAEIH